LVSWGRKSWCPYRDKLGHQIWCPGDTNSFYSAGIEIIVAAMNAFDKVSAGQTCMYVAV